MLDAAEEATAMDDLSNFEWRRSPYCESTHCVETAAFTGGTAIRDSKDADGPVLVFGTAEWVAFSAAICEGTIG
jgi:uncharacterized protein DUF397